MKLQLTTIPGLYAICRLSPTSQIPFWATSGDFVSITKTTDELSIVCPQYGIPDGVRCERDWKCLRVAGKLDFSLVGVLSSLTSPLAAAGISVFAISTFDTDYLLVKAENCDQALAILKSCEQ